MILRDYQQEIVNKATHALGEYDNTLCVSPTGSGKTVTLSAVIDEMLTTGTDRAVVVQHREELTNQNMATFRKVASDRPVSRYDGHVKSWDGQVTFGSIQTLSRPEHLNSLRTASLLVYDEAHHSRAESYQRLTNRCKELNQDIKVFGVTATAERGDKRGLKPTFDNVCAVVQLGDMIKRGFLVEPKGMVIDLGIQDDLANLQSQKRSDFADQGDIEALMNTQANNNSIVREWRQHAEGRQSVFFCATISHAEAVAEAFCQSGIDAMAVHSKLKNGDRKGRLEMFENGEIQVLTNPMLLTEGWDSPACSCVGLLRACSFKSTFIQMAGRGLRINPNGIKKDCVILDFGLSILTHGDLETNILFDDNAGKGEAPTKECPDCETMVPAGCGFCPICGHKFESEKRETKLIESFQMSAFDLINQSPFKWVSLFPGDRVQVTTGFDAWAAVVTPDNETYFSIGGIGKTHIRRLLISNEVQALAAADDFMREHETNKSAKKSAKWMMAPATVSQEKWLRKFGYDIGFMGSEYNKAQAAARLTFHFNLKKIERLMEI